MDLVPKVPMLQSNKSEPVLLTESESSNLNLSAPDQFVADLLAAAIGLIRRQSLLILAVGPLVMGLAALYLLTTPPLYSAQAIIMIDIGKVKIFPQSILAGDTVDSATVDSQIEILKSENLALSVIKDLHLDKDAEFIKLNSGLIGNVLNVLLRPFRSRRLEGNESDTVDRALAVFERRLKLKRVGLTYAIEIEFQSQDPVRAAQIANAVADTFIVHQLEARYQTIRTATAWLQDRLTELRSQAAAAERAVVEYKAKNNIVDPGGKLINEQQLAELNTALVKARADTVEAQARLDRVSQILRADNLDPTGSDVATVADTLHNDIITTLRKQYLELSRREALFSSRYGKDHLAVVNLHNQMREISKSIADELKQIAAAYQSDFNIAKARESSMQASLDALVAGSQTTNKAQIELRQLESAAQSYRALYDSFQQRYMDSVQQQSFPMAEASVITRATRPSAPSSPKPMTVGAAATIGWLVLGFGLAMLRETTERVFRTSGQVEAQLQTECLAFLPKVKLDAKAAAISKTAVISDKAGAKPPAVRIIAQNKGLFRYVVDYPLSRFAEAIRAIKISADLGGVGQSNRVIGITSSVPNEGKSTLAVSLAQLSASCGARVILVDCDLRRPALSRELAPNASLGLLDVITERAKLDDVVWRDPKTHLCFLPMVSKSRLDHTSEILGSAALKRLFVQLREFHDYVIVDLPPTVPLVDVRSTGHLVDAYVYVIEWGKTKIDVVTRGLKSARTVYDSLLGVVLSKADFNLLGRYESYYGSEYSRYYGEYGFKD
jgi:succinoglycan biosynthesis transport protein ExoP